MHLQRLHGMWGVCVCWNLPSSLVEMSRIIEQKWGSIHLQLTGLLILSCILSYPSICLLRGLVRMQVTVETSCPEIGWNPD